MPFATFNRFEIRLSLREARVGSHPGPCDGDVAYLRTLPQIARQLSELEPASVAAELKEYGAWSPEELADGDANLTRILWLACGQITEEAV